MYVNRDSARKIVRGAAENLSFRRAWTWAGFGGAWAGLRSAVAVGRAADDLLYPAWRGQRVREPVFIFANGRSGTTMLHRLLSTDTEHFAGYRLYQSIFSAVSIQRLFEGLGRTPGVGALGRKGVEAINQAFFSGWEGIHEMGIDKEEEDEALFALTCETPTVSLLNPFMEGYSHIGWLDEAPPEQRRGFMDFYEAAVKKHLYAVGGDKHFLTKNVFTTPRVRTFLERFPDGRFVYLIRHPYKSLPSWLNMFHEKWVTHSPELVHDSPQARELAQMYFDYYRYALELKRTLPEERLRVVRYEELVRDPKRVVEGVYEWLGETMSPGYRKTLEEMTTRQKRYKSAHRYSLAQFGLTEEWVYRQIPEVFEAFGYAEDGPQGLAPAA